MPDLDSLINRGFAPGADGGGRRLESEQRLASSEQRLADSERDVADEFGVDLGSIRRLSSDLHEYATPPLARAFEKLVDLRVADLAPTAFTMPLFVAYAETEGYLVQRVRRRVRRLTEASDRLLDSHETWTAAELAGTLVPAGNPDYA